MKPTLYKIHLINRHGHIMYERYVVASGVNAAKRGLRESSPYYKDVKFKVVECSDVLVVDNEPKEEVRETREEFFKRFDEAWDNKEMWGGEYGEGI
jgi:hypothetical protein